MRRVEHRPAKARGSKGGERGSGYRAHYPYLFSPGPIPTSCGFGECYELSSGSGGVLLWPPKVFKRILDAKDNLSWYFHSDRFPWRCGKILSDVRKIPLPNSYALPADAKLATGSVGQWVSGSWVTWVNKPGWVTWVIGMCDQLTRDPLTDN